MRSNFPSKKHLWLITSIFTGLIALALVANHYMFRTDVWDYGSYNFAFYDYAHGKISPNPLYYGTFLQDHFSLTLIILAPLYWLLNWLTGTYTLLIIQSALIGLGVWFSARIILLKSNDPWLALAVIVLNFTIVGRWSSLMADCNLAIMSACLVPVFLFYVETRKFIQASVILLLGLVSRENMPLWFFFIFIVLILNNFKDRRLVIFSISEALASVLYFIILFALFIPAIETPDRPYNLFNYAALGSNPAEAFVYILNHPVESIRLFFVNHLNNPEYNGIKLKFYWVYFLSGGFLLLLRPRYLIWFFPLIAQKMLNDNPFRWGIWSYYSIEIVTLLPLSILLVITELKSGIHRKVLVFTVLLSSLGTSIFLFLPIKNEVNWEVNSTKTNIFSGNFYQSSAPLNRTYRLISSIPPDAVVSASGYFVPHLAQRSQIYYFPRVYEAEYILFSYNDLYFPYQSSDQLIHNFHSYLLSPDWQIADFSYPVVLMKKEKEKINFGRKKIIVREFECDVEKLSVNGDYFLTSNGETISGTCTKSIEKARSGQYSQRISPENPFGMGYIFTNLQQFDYIEISVWAHSPSNNCFIVLSNDADIYVKSNEVTETDSAGWNKIRLTYFLRDKNTLKNLKFYTWNPGNEIVYLDDLTIVCTHYSFFDSWINKLPAKKEFDLFHSLIDVQ